MPEVRAVSKPLGHSDIVIRIGRDGIELMADPAHHSAEELDHVAMLLDLVVNGEGGASATMPPG